MTEKTESQEAKKETTQVTNGFLQKDHHPQTKPVSAAEAAVAPEGIARIVIDFNPETHDFQARWNLADICMLYGMLALCNEQIVKNRTVAKAQMAVLGAIQRAEEKEKGIKTATVEDLRRLDKK